MPDFKKIILDYRDKLEARTIKNVALITDAPKLLELLIDTTRKTSENIEARLALIEAISSGRTTVKTAFDKKSYIQEQIQLEAEKKRLESDKNQVRPGGPEERQINSDLAIIESKLKFIKATLFTPGFRKWFENVLKFMGLIRKTDLDDVLEEAKKTLQTERNELGTTTQYTPAQIAASGNFNPISFLAEHNEQNRKGVIEDFARNATLNNLDTRENFDTRGKKEEAIRAQIEGFTKGHPLIRDFILETPSQFMQACLEQELRSSYLGPGLSPKSDLNVLRWTKKGDDFFFEGTLNVRGVEVDETHAILSRPEVIGTEAPQAEEFQLGSPSYQAFVTTQQAHKPFDPILSASIRVKLTIDPITNKLTPQVVSVEATSFVSNFERTPRVFNYSDAQLREKGAVLAEILRDSAKSPSDDRDITDSVLVDFRRNATLKGQFIAMTNDDNKDHTSLADGIRKLTAGLSGEGSLAEGFAKVIATTTPQEMKAIAIIGANEAIPDLNHNEKLKPYEMSWSIIDGNLCYKMIANVEGIQKPSAGGTFLEGGTIAEEGKLKHIEDPEDFTKALKGRGLESIATVEFIVTFSKDANGVVQPPVLTSLRVQTNFPEAYPLAAPSANPSSTIQADAESGADVRHSVGPTWTAAHVEPSAESANNQQPDATTEEGNEVWRQIHNVAFDRDSFSEGDEESEAGRVEADENSDTGLSG